jgi:recombinational DNA repair ATPase RecF
MLKQQCEILEQKEADLTMLTSTQATELVVAKEVIKAREETISQLNAKI